MPLWRCSPLHWLACCAALAPTSAPAVWWMTATSVWHHSSASVLPQPPQLRHPSALLLPQLRVAKIEKFITISRRRWPDPSHCLPLPADCLLPCSLLPLFSTLCLLPSIPLVEAVTPPCNNLAIITYCQHRHVQQQQRGRIFQGFTLEQTLYDTMASYTIVEGFPNYAKLSLILLEFLMHICGIFVSIH